MPEPIQWEIETNTLQLLDQTRLPVRMVNLTCRTHIDVCRAIKRLSVRGAPAIGIAAAYGVSLAAFHAGLETDEPAQRNQMILHAIRKLSETRPTAMNLFWALNQMKEVLSDHKDAPSDELASLLLRKAYQIHEDDRHRCEQIGEHGVELLHDRYRILTHCNAGVLATGGIGTALAPIYVGRQRGMIFHLFVDETRPLLQGSRLTAWELTQAGIDVTLISDNTAAYAIRKKNIQCVILGADRITTHGDVANKIGTYNLAILAKEHAIPFYVAAPLSTFDPTIASGDDIPIEQHDEVALTESFGKRMAPLRVKTFVPAFDVTPHRYITAIITEKGILRPPFRDAIARVRADCDGEFG
ncbi:MAG: S-methyl-5-thioribose-1-phosphate isomerase [Candidatus Cloacimonetes bacterium 4572_55]|nr:MAG: S-methyl-5-thioribose-1-phosphate isomerase [Candidatus Cloacimonetes bacterium 4572_55]